MTHSAPLLSIRKLTRWFGSIAAVRDLDLQVHEGDIYGFLGLNGAGKTTTLRATLGLLRPSAGEIELFGKKVGRAHPENRRGLGALVESPAFFGRLDGLGNLRALGRLSGHVGRDDALHLLDLVGLSRAALRPARTYSLGMKQRLGIALALVANPRLIILDEPTNGLDPQGIRDMRGLLLRLNAENGLTIMISSHLLAEVEQLCTRVGIIHEGKLVTEGGMDDLMRTSGERIRLVARPEERAMRVISESFEGVRVTRENGGLMLSGRADLETPALVRRLVDDDVDVDEVTREKLSLEQIFLERVPAGEQES